MEYVCMIFPDRQTGVDKEGAGETTNERNDLRARIVLGAQAIGAPNSAITLSLCGTDLSVTEGSARMPGDGRPRCYLLEAIDLNDAIRVASLLPEATTGRLELRPILTASAAMSRGAV